MLTAEGLHMLPRVHPDWTAITHTPGLLVVERAMITDHRGAGISGREKAVLPTYSTSDSLAGATDDASGKNTRLFTGGGKCGLDMFVDKDLPLSSVACTHLLYLDSPKPSWGETPQSRGICCTNPLRFQ